MGKGRNNNVVSLLGLIIGIFAYYYSWCTYSLVNFGVFAILPSSIMKIMSIGLDHGFWSIGNGPLISGTPLLAVWALEAIIIVFLPCFMALSINGEKIFCEKCNKWSSKLENIKNFNVISDYDELVNRLKARDYSMFKKLPEPSDSFIDMKILSCPKCNDLNVLTIYEEQVIKNIYGQNELLFDYKVSNLLISKSAVQYIKSL